MSTRAIVGAILGAFVLILSSATSPPAAHAAFPGANGKIAFTSDRDGNWEIYVMNADGTGLTRLTNNPANEFLPAWSPDGTKILFSGHRNSFIFSEVYVMNADGSGVTNLTNNPRWDGIAVFSPDGTKIAFQSDRDGNFEIYVMNADGSGVTRLTNNGAYESFPAWSPDGTKIAFQSDRDGNDEVYVMNADGSGQTRLTNNPAFDAYPDWSPGGTKIAFTSGRDGNNEIYVMNADGTGLTRLTNNPGSEGLPAWSPDGAKIAFESDRDGNNEIYVMNANGSSQTRITNNSGYDAHPDWQPLSRLTNLSPAKIWVGLKNSDDMGLKVDLQAEVRVNSVVVSTGTLLNVATGSSGFNNALLDTINFTSVTSVSAGTEDKLSITLYVRNTCAAGGHNSGTARLWFNGAAIDIGAARDAGSRFDATISPSVSSDYFLRPLFALSTTAGSPRTFVDVAAGAKCSAYKTFGTWGITLP
jgi:TolB protein